MNWYSLIVPMRNERFETGALYWTHLRNFPLFTYYYSCHIFYNFSVFPWPISSLPVTIFLWRGGGGLWSNPLYLSLLKSLTVWTFNIQRKPLQQSFLSLMKDNVWNPFVRQNSSCVEKSIYVVVNFLSQVIFLFLFFFFSTSLATLPYPKTKKNYLR